jgi:nucleotide sugar dehydrogenase
MELDTRITVVGVGRLGLCIALSFERVGYNVVGVDTNESYVRSLNEKTFRSYEPYVSDYLRASKNFKATTSLEEGLAHSDIIFIMVPTPQSGGVNFYDHSILSSVLLKINSLKPVAKHFIVGCTVTPQYIDTIGRSLLADTTDCTLNYHPEFVAQGSIIDNYRNPDIILIGQENPLIGERIERVCRSVILGSSTICRLPILDAELTKIALNGFLTMKIAYANLIGDLCTKMGANPENVLESIGRDSRIGTKYLKYGFSYGGPCLPRDARNLANILENNGFDASLLKSTDKANENHVDFQMGRYIGSANGDKNMTFTVTGVCYKNESNIPIIEESARLKIAYRLAIQGYKVVIVDQPHIIDEVRKTYGMLFGYQPV